LALAAAPAALALAPALTGPLTAGLTLGGTAVDGLAAVPPPPQAARIRAVARLATNGMELRRGMRIFFLLFI
jgi:hypothetical protein